MTRITKISFALSIILFSVPQSLSMSTVILYLKNPSENGLPGLWLTRNASYGVVVFNPDKTISLSSYDNQNSATQKNEKLEILVKRGFTTFVKLLKKHDESMKQNFSFENQEKLLKEMHTQLFKIVFPGKTPNEDGVFGMKLK